MVTSVRPSQRREVLVFAEPGADFVAGVVGDVDPSGDWDLF